MLAASPSAMVGRMGISTSRPAASACSMAGDAEDWTPTTRIEGLTAFSQVPIPLISPPPPTGTSTVVRSGTSSSNSTPIDPWVVAGQGTIGVELLEDVPDLTTVLVPVGGGGLISGIGTWLKAVRPSIRVVGVQSSASPAMEQALAAGRLVEIPILPTIADGLAANIQPGSITFPLAQKAVDEMVLVSEEEIAETIAATFQEIHVALEGSAVVGIAALRTGKLPDKEGKIAVVVTGRNIAAERLCGILARG